ncbi:MAG: hypothetical protein CMJ51_06905 [Planctomycetaceae bacterium]|nr:hypothetical protein [Planctomycetaceae bacterium]
MSPINPRSDSRSCFRGRALPGLLLALTSVSSLVGCASEPSEGWSMTWTHPEQYRSISIPIFVNQTYFRGLERELGRALVTEVEASTPYKVTGPGTADTLLRGSIRDAELIPLSQSPLTGLPAEMLFKVEIDFEWIDLATGEPVVSRNGFTASALFTPSRPAMETIDLARFGVVQQLATDLVDVLRDDW